MYPAEPHCNVTSDDFADEDLASLLRGDGMKKIDLVASMHMLKLQRLTAKLGKTATSSYLLAPSKTSFALACALKQSSQW